MKFIYTMSSTLVLKKLESTSVRPDIEEIQLLFETSDFKLLYDPTHGICIEANIENFDKVVDFFNYKKLPLSVDGESLIVMASPSATYLKQKGFMRTKGVWKYVPKSA